MLYTPLSLLVLGLGASAAPLADLTVQHDNAPTTERLASLAKAVSPFSFLGDAFDLVKEIEHDLFEPTHEGSILDIIESDPNYSKITKLVKMDGLAAKYLGNSANHVTFFAPNNNAFPEHHDHHDDFSNQGVILNEILAVNTLEPLDDKDDEKKKKFRKILRGVLQYHMSDSVLSTTELIANSTIATGLRSHLGALLDEQQRIKVTRSLLPVPHVKLNEYASIVKSDGMATNGVVHGLDHPLLPPADIFDEAFLFPTKFSTSTSALQKTGLNKLLTFSHEHGYFAPSDELSHNGPPAVTAFVPTNSAWERIPEKLAFFLFSPFGEHALRRLLEYHVLPDGAVYSERVIMKSKHHHHHSGSLLDHDHYEHNVTVPTAAKGECVNLFVKKTENPLGAVEIDFEVNGKAVQVVDVPARNGAIHVMHDVLIPGGRHSWEGWSDGGRDSWFAKFVRGEDHQHHKH